VWESDLRIVLRGLRHPIPSGFNAAFGSTSDKHSTYTRSCTAHKFREVQDSRHAWTDACSLIIRTRLVLTLKRATIAHVTDVTHKSVTVTRTFR
jgi:hypothetical protein